LNLTLTTGQMNLMFESGYKKLQMETKNSLSSFKISCHLATISLVYKRF
jgi:hypothetical protein